MEKESGNTLTTHETNFSPLTAEPDLISQAKKLYDQYLAPNTRRVYASDWNIFKNWCQEKNFLPENATPETLVLFLTEQFQQHYHPQTLTRRLAAIKFNFTQNKKTSPTDHPVVRNLLKGIHRDKNVKTSQPKKAVSVSLLKSMVDLCPISTLRGIRDKAILLLGFAGGFRRSELANLHIEDISFQDKGMDIKIRHSKTDQEGKGKIKAIIYAKDKTYCPCTAIIQWIEKSKLTTGAIFRGITQHHTLKENALSQDRIYALIKRYTIALGHDFSDFSPHSLRSGFVTSALEANALPSKILEVTHHATLKSLQPYIKHAERFEQHAGENLL